MYKSFMVTSSVEETYSSSTLCGPDLSTADESYDYLISDKATEMIKWVIDASICQVIAIFGIGTNIVNIICFFKQGFKDPVNVSLLGTVVDSAWSCLSTFIDQLLFTVFCLNEQHPF